MKIDLLECIKYGIFMGMGFCLYTIFMWLTKLDSTYLNMGQYLDMAIILLPLSIISLAIHKQNKLSAVTFFQRVCIAVLIGAVSFIIYDPFLYLYHHAINPEWFSYVMSLREMELNEANASPEIINEELQRMKSSSMANAGLFQLSSIFGSVIIIPISISIISLSFIKKN